ncbi:MAG TPA: FHA domain-containing protein [Anaeromyxobacteraceae bacterium]|nr:FHA domain-containing protein [Anaeromyxobacteraceae bacterium]
MASVALKCPRCGKENDPSFSFCLDCGQAIRAAAERLCPHCSAKMPAAFRFCGHCGRPVEPAPHVTGKASLAAAAAPPPPAPPEAVEVPPPHLVLVRHDGQPGQVLELSKDVTLCGRKEGDILLPEDGSVSPRHASWTFRDGRLRLEDLGSASGSFVRIRGPRSITFGDEVRMGRQLLRLEPLPREAAAPGEARPWGSPDPGFRMRLVQLLEGGGTGEVFPLRLGANSVGREMGDVTFPGDRYVSGRHARIDVTETAVTVTDLGSSNGTFLRVTGPTDLAAGDQVLLGMQLLRVEA